MRVYKRKRDKIDSNTQTIFELLIFCYISTNVATKTNHDENRFYPPQTAPDAAATAINALTCTSTIVENDCLIMADYLFYPDLMQELAEEIMSKGGYDIAYDEIITQKIETQIKGITEHDIQIMEFESAIQAGAITIINNGTRPVPPVNIFERVQKTKHLRKSTKI